MPMYLRQKAPLAAAFALIAATVMTPASALEAVNDQVVAPAPVAEAVPRADDAFAKKRQTARRIARPASADPEIARLMARLAVLTGPRPCNYLGCRGYVIVGVQY